MNGDESIKEKEGRVITKGIEGGGEEGKIKSSIHKNLYCFLITTSINN